MSEKTQGKTPESMNNQEKSMNQLSEAIDGLPPTRQPFFPEYHKNPKIQNVLIQMLKDNKSDYTINFTRKARAKF